MIIFKKALAVIIFFLFCISANSHADVVDKVVAIVNDEVITLSEVNEEGKALLQKVASTVPASELTEALKQVRQKILEQLIEKKIMLQEAEKEKITVTEAEIESAYTKIIERNKISPEMFHKELEAIGMTEKLFRENLKTQVLSSKLVNLEIRSKVIIPEDKVIDYYDTKYTERVGEGGYYLLQIGIAWGIENDETETSPLTKEAARQKAEQVRERIISGKDFKEMARQHSSLPSSVDGGDIGILKKDDMSSKMLEVISQTKPGNISPIIETSSGFQFFKVLSSQEGQIITKVPYESVKDEIYDILYQQEMEARYKQWLQDMKSRAYIKIL